MQIKRFVISLCVIVGLLHGLSPAISAPTAPLQERLPPVRANNIELVGQLGGASYAVAWHEDKALLYATFGPRLIVFDTSDAEDPQVIGQTSVLPDITRDVALAGDYAYVAAGNSGLIVVDISESTRPVVVGFYQTEAFVSAVDVAGDYVYLAVADGSMRVVNIATPSEPSLAGRYNAGAVGHSVAVVGDHVYFGVGNALHIVNVSQSTSPAWVRELNFDYPIRGITFADGRAYIANDRDGLRILDITDVTDPQEIGSYDVDRGFRGFAHDVAVSGDYAYIASERRGVRVVNVSDPESPTEVSSYGDYDPDDLVSDYDYTYGVTVAGTRLYVAARYVGVRVVDVRTPADPIELGSYTRIGNSQGVAVSGYQAYVADGDFGIHAVSLRTPSAPLWLNRLRTGGYVHNVVARAPYVYVADGLRGMTVLDATSPAALKRVAGFNTPGRAYDLALHEQHVYIADGGAFGSTGEERASGLIVLDISTPISPTEIGYTFTLGTARGIVVNNDRAYIADGSRGVVIMDISDPAWPQNIGFFTRPGLTARDIAAWGDYAYFTDKNTLHIIDLSNPASPRYVGDYATPGGTESVSIVGNYAVVADGSRGVRVLDLSEDPENPTEVAYYDTPGDVRRATMVGRYIYVADGQGGLMILWLRLEGTATISTPGGTFTMPDGTIYTFPANSFSDTVLLQHSPREPGSVPAPPHDLGGIDHFFEVTAVYSDTGQPAHLKSGTIYTITIPYLKEELNVVDESSLALYRWDDETWTTADLTGTVNMDARALTVTADRLALFGVLGRTHRVYLPIVVRRY